MSLFEARTLTAIVAIALGTLAVTGGIGAIRFDIARKAAAGAAPAQALNAWTGTTGLGSLALEAQLRSPVPDSGMEALNKRHDILSRLLATRPLSAQDWMTLAAVRHSLALPTGAIDKAFAMSGLTGPAEGDVMAQRALFGILLWEASPPEAHARTLTDLCGLTVHDPSRLKLVLSTKSDGVRTAIRNGLLDHACTPRMVAVIGL